MSMQKVKVCMVIKSVKSQDYVCVKWEYKSTI